MEPEIVSEMPVSICHTATHFIPLYNKFVDLLQVFEVLWASVIIRPLARRSRLRLVSQPVSVATLSAFYIFAGGSGFESKWQQWRIFFFHVYSTVSVVSKQMSTNIFINRGVMFFVAVLLNIRNFCDIMPSQLVNSFLYSVEPPSCRDKPSEKISCFGLFIPED